MPHVPKREQPIRFIKKKSMLPFSTLCNEHAYKIELTLSQTTNFRLFQTERVSKQQFQT